MNLELNGGQTNNQNTTLQTIELDNLLSVWEAEIISQEDQQRQIITQLRNFDEQQIVQKVTEQKNKIQQLQMYEQMNENHNNALKQLIQDKQSTQEQQLKFIKEQHSQEVLMHQKNLEEALQKNLKTINTLISEKKELSDQLEQVFGKLEEEQDSNQKKVKKMKQFYETELKNQKDTLLSKEKKDREKWQKEKAEKIRELTIKGLEPELQNLIEKHNLETKQLKLEYQQKLVKMRQELTAEQQLQLQQIKNSQLFFTNNFDFNQLTINNNNSTNIVNTVSKLDNLNNNNLFNKEIGSNNNLQEDIQFEKSPVINQNPTILDEIVGTNPPNNVQKNGIFSSYNYNPSLLPIQNSDQKQPTTIVRASALKVPEKIEGVSGNNVYSNNQNHFLFQQQNNQQPTSQSQLPSLVINNRIQNNFLTPHIKKKTIKQNQFGNS